MINLRISEEVFDELYPDLAGLYDHFDQPPPSCISKEHFERYYLSSKLWRLNNLYSIIDKYGEVRTFRMSHAQHKVYSANRVHPRLIILKSRQQGISTLYLVSFFDDCVFGANFNIGLMAQGTDEASTLLERVKFLWERLDNDVKAFAGVHLIVDNVKEFSLSNKCSLFIRVSFRSATLHRLHISEFGKIANEKPARAIETKTGTLQAIAPANPAVIESTAEGYNEFKTMWDNAVLAQHSGQFGPKDFYPVFLSWLDDPDCWLEQDQAIDSEAEQYFEKLEKDTGRTLTRQQKNFWVQQRRELGAFIHQEYPGTPEEAFGASRDGTYFSRMFNEKCVRHGGLVPDLYDPALPVSVYFDLGIDDYMTLVYVQYYDGKYRIIRDYHNDGYSLEWYIDRIIEWGVPVAELVFPWDIEARQLIGGNSAGLARTRLDILREYLAKTALAGVRVRVMPRTGIADGIEAVRRMIPNMYIDPVCVYLIDCLNKYTREWDKKLNKWKDTPLHNEYSHGADVLRGIAMTHIEVRRERHRDSGDGYAV